MAERVCADLDPAADHHGSALYRKEVAGTLVERALDAAARGGTR